MNSVGFGAFILGLCLFGASLLLPAQETSPTPQTQAERRRLARRRHERQQRISRKAVAYLWDQRLDAETGRIGKVQGRYLQALSYLALVADGSDDQTDYRERLNKVVAELKQPLANLDPDNRTARKLYLGTSRDVLAFETHAVVALAYEHLLASPYLTPAERELFLKGADGAIEYIYDYRRRGRDYARLGGWPVNSAPHNRNRPDRRCTAIQLLLLKTHTYNGQKVNTTTMKEAPNFILAAQRTAPEKTEELEKATAVYKEWAPRLRRGAPLPVEVRDAVNKYLEYQRQLDESGGFGIDTIGVISPGATAVGLFTLANFAVDEEDRLAAAARSFQQAPLSWDAQRFFLTQFFATRGLFIYSETYETADYQNHMERLLSLLEQRQAPDGSFPLGSRGVEELTQMERVYTTAMCVLIVNADRGNLIFDRLPY